MTLPTPAELPEPLTEYDQWVCWRTQTRGDKPTKVPINPHTGRYASATDAETWSSFETAREYADDEAADGIGFVFTAADPFVGIDLDDARDPDTETPNDWARSIIDELDSYTEVSPSGTGYHVIVDGELPPGRNRRGDVELYETARFFTMTGAHVESAPTAINERTDALATVYADHVADEAASTAKEGTAGSDDGRATGRDESAVADQTATLSDEQLLTRARAASNGAKFERLWRGETRGYDSHSEADMALACLLAFWTGGNATQMDRLFRRSGLMREKWDAVHYADGRTYGEATIERAVDVTTEYYSPDDASTQQSDDTGRSSSESQVDESGVDVQPPADDATVYEREQARIETIQTLERRLSELEGENERLRDELAAERAARESLADEVSEEPSGVMNWLRGLFAGDR